ncbi:M15 family metallopeptidase [Kribbella jejuensis]|uniref:D-alanyl-D-alanine carboxypeptidase-like protein n=1 Tax=Kribbella jejuensis TaxID=236068 RepID=A0A542ERV6_9ACTN|nr:M15 family metallopeptidase [Kribbella jejuensis]TQJ18081.1 D-alanyl-D-alanine carboxypeptidase-like protein [Kribbella jejuensis]
MVTSRILAGFAMVAVVIGLAVTACTTGAARSEPPSTHSAPSKTTSTSAVPTHKGPPNAEDGVLPDHTSAYDTDLPGIAKLDPALRKAVQEAETAMRADGIRMQVTTGWRSKKYQEELLEKAILRYGSRKKALEYVAEPNESHHVTGHAVDIGPAAADHWLERKGNRYGLCRTYTNEIWHFELVTTPGGSCPPMIDPTR